MGLDHDENPTNQKFIKSLPTNAEHSGKVRIEEEYIDPKEKPSNEENTESLSTGTDTTGDLTAEGQAAPSEL